MDNKTIQGLWIGGKLSLMEQLTINSFIQQGHVFHLYVYDELETQIHPQAEVCDANEILNRKHIFKYKNYNQFGHGKGSVSGFSDIFRYKLLYEKGGWWVDMDVTCLQPLNITEPYYFRKHHELLAVGNVMKAPAKSQLMLQCFEQAIREVNENNTDWHKPINILNFHIEKLGLQQYVGDGISNRDWWLEIIDFLYGKKRIPKSWKFIHWTNENFRAFNMDKNNFKIRSTYGNLLRKNGVIQKKFSAKELVMNSLKYNAIHKLVKGYYKPY